MFEPHIFVVGTGDPAQTDINRRLVSEDRRYTRHGNCAVEFPAVDDTEVTDKMLSEHNLVLYGNPTSNRVLKRVLDTGKLPLSFKDNAIHLGKDSYRGDDVGVKLIYPNPFNSERVVVIVAGTTWKGTLLSRHLPRFIPDYIVYDSRMKGRYKQRILIDRPVLKAGFFNTDWTL